MSTKAEQIEAIRFAVQIAEKQLKSFQNKPHLTRSEHFEKIMTEAVIKRGKEILKESTP